MAKGTIGQFHVILKYKYGLLYRQDRKDKPLVKIILPESLRSRVLRLAHFSPLSGYSGQT